MSVLAATGTRATYSGHADEGAVRIGPGSNHTLREGSFSSRGERPLAAASIWGRAGLPLQFPWGAPVSAVRKHRPRSCPHRHGYLPMGFLCILYRDGEQRFAGASKKLQEQALRRLGRARCDGIVLATVSHLRAHAIRDPRTAQIRYSGPQEAHPTCKFPSSSGLPPQAIGGGGFLVWG